MGEAREMCLGFVRGVASSHMIELLDVPIFPLATALLPPTRRAAWPTAMVLVQGSQKQMLP